MSTQPYPAPTFDRYVLFVDILGFGDCVTANPASTVHLKPVLDIAPKLDALREWPYPSSRPRLVRLFEDFHRAFDFHVHQHRRHDVVAMSFSDCGFVAFDDFHHMAGFARDFMRTLIGMYVPARMGIAKGSIRPLRFLSDNTDVAHIHASQFAGTGVVFAFRAAEKQGLRGIG